MKVSCRCCTQGFFSQQRTRLPKKKQKKGTYHKQQKNYKKLVFGVNKPFQQEQQQTPNVGDCFETQIGEVLAPGSG